MERTRDAKGEYYAALESWDAARNLTPARDFLVERIVKTWRGRIRGDENKIADSPRLNDFL